MRYRYAIEELTQKPPVAVATPLRIALIGTPRSGNNWVMHLLSALYDLPMYATNSLLHLNWSKLPTRCVFILHWHHEPALVEQLRREGCHIVVLARHPLDVLLSILRYSIFDATAWLEGEGGGEQSIRTVLPCSEAFLHYATGPRAAALLSISREWWTAPDCIKIRYEDMIQNAQGEAERLIDDIGESPHRALAEAVSATSLKELRKRHLNRRYHFWQGQPGLWKKLLPPHLAHAIAAAHEPVFTELGYACDPDPDLDGEQANGHWMQLHGPTLLENQRCFLQQANARLAQVGDLGPIAIDVARRIRRLSLSFPRLASAAKWVICRGK